MKVAVIIPAYNEAARIWRVVRVACRTPGVGEVLVVSDGSQDRTAEVAARCGARVLELPRNVGKGGAMMAGARSTDAEVVLFLDADLIGLRPAHLRDLLDPVVQGEADMTLGVFEEGRLATDLAQRIAPFLSGQRALRRRLLETIPHLEEAGFGVEVLLSRYAERAGWRVKRVVLTRVAQVMKEEKAGLWQGLRARVRMYWEILKSYR